MTKQDVIKYWLKESTKDWNRALRCFKHKDYLFCLFCAHLSLEKLCKAIWVRDNIENHPPRIHNLRYILDQTTILLSVNQKEFLTLMNTFQIEGRYPDYTGKIYKICNQKFTKETLDQSKNIRQWLQKNLQ